MSVIEDLHREDKTRKTRGYTYLFFYDIIKNNISQDCLYILSLTISS